MRHARLTVLLGVVLSGACVCVVQPTTGDLSIFYTFGGASCVAAGVDRIHLVASGDTQGDGATKTVTCAGFGQGLTLKDLVSDTYRVTVEGWDSAGNVLYASTPQHLNVVAGSDNQYDVDAPAVVGDLTVYWTFNGVTSCSAAGVDTVDYYLYDPTGTQVDAATFACNSAGATWTALDPGQWSVDLDGFDAGGTKIYSGSGVTPVVAGQSNTYTVDMAPQ
jgi:hypothetical protein